MNNRSFPFASAFWAPLLPLARHGVVAFSLFVSAVALGQSVSTNPSPALEGAVARTVRSFETLATAGSDTAQYRARQPGQRLQSSFDLKGTLTLSVGSDQLGVRVSAFGRGREATVPGTPIASTGSDPGGWPKLSFGRPTLSEWYVNGQAGLHHWMQLAKRPPASAPSSSVWIRLAVSGDAGLQLVGDQAVDLRTKAHTFAYAGLKVWDSTGRELPARFEASGREITVHIEDAGASYPVTIDPVWSEQQVLRLNPIISADSFSYKTAIYGDTAFVTAPNDDGTTYRGAAYVFTRTAGVWTFAQKLIASDAANDDQFGFSLAFDGTTAMIGAPQNGNGAVYVFRQSGSVWLEQQILTVAQPNNLLIFGRHIAISGNTAMISDGSYNYQTLKGAVHMFERSGNVWTEAQELKIGDNTTAFWLGYPVAIEGNVAMVGVRNAAGGFGSTGLGGVRVYQRFQSPISPTFGPWVYQLTLLASDGLSGNDFGRAIALNQGTLLVGAPKKASGLGSVYVFTGSGSSWTEQQQLVQSDITNKGNFGHCIALLGGSAAIGAPNKGFGLGYGGAYMFARTGTVWAQQQLLSSSAPFAFEGYGYSASMQGDTVLIGNFGGDGGATFVYTRPGSLTLTFSPSALTGGLASTGTVALSSIAPIGGATVNLSSDIPTEFPVPPTVVVPAGLTTVSFNVTSTPVTANQAGHVTASCTGFGTDVAPVTVKKAKVFKLQFIGADVNMGGIIAGKVVLTGPASAGGFPVTLTPDVPGALSVPTSVTVPQGQTSVMFNSTGLQVVSDTIVTVTTGPGLPTKSDWVTVHAVADLVSVSLADPIVRIGTSTLGTVTLSAPASSSGQIINLTSSDPSVTVPSNLTVPSGAATATFPASSIGTTNVTATIKAIYGATTRSAMFKAVRPMLTSASISPSSVVGGNSVMFTVVLNGPAPAGGVQVNFISADPSRATFSSGQLTIPAGSSSINVLVTTTAGPAIQVALRGQIVGETVYKQAPLTITH